MESELVELDTIYADPGFLLLARDTNSERLGCVGLRLLDGLEHATVRTGEIRRLFVRETSRGTGTGHALTTRLLNDARDNGFERLVLNTVPTMTEAIRIYRHLGFAPCETYVDTPLDDTLYFSLDL